METPLELYCSGCEKYHKHKPVWGILNRCICGCCIIARAKVEEFNAKNR